MSGFFDAEGSVYLDKESGHIFLNVTHNNKYLLDPLITLYSGRVQPILFKEAFEYYLYKKEEVLRIVDKYFSKYTLMSSKRCKLSLIENYYLNKDHKTLNMI